VDTFHGGSAAWAAAAIGGGSEEVAEAQAGQREHLRHRPQDGHVETGANALDAFEQRQISLVDDEERPGPTARERGKVRGGRRGEARVRGAADEHSRDRRAGELGLQSLEGELEARRRHVDGGHRGATGPQRLLVFTESGPDDETPPIRAGERARHSPDELDRAGADHDTVRGHVVQPGDRLADGQRGRVRIA
jgi:hypothetical protein